MNKGPVLTPGSFGAEVRRLQRILVSMGVLSYEHLSGDFDLHTQNALAAIQKSNKLSVTKICDENTWRVLTSDPRTKLMMIGMKSVKIKQLQTALTLFNPSLYTGPIDGIFGSLTEKAVYQYQQRLGIYTDGIVGDQTWWTPIAGQNICLARLAGFS